MPVDLKGRSLLTLEEFPPEAVDRLIALAAQRKAQKRDRIFPHALEDRNICLVFLKPSTRTRAAFSVAAADEGAHVDIYGEADLRFGVKESVRDIARVLGRMYDGIAFRGFDHATCEALAQDAGVPVWNALTDDHHPTQILADLLTLQERFGPLAGLKLAFVGDGRNNMGRSLMIAAAKMGLDLRIIAPAALQPHPATVEAARRSAEHPDAAITVTDDVHAGVEGCHAIYGDIWLSMGEEHLVATRIPMLQGFKITDAMLDATHRPDSVFLHCLPSLHDAGTKFGRDHPDGLDTDDALFEGERSLVFEQAENRMHAIKALMVATV